MHLHPILNAQPLVLPLYDDCIQAGFPSPAQGYEAQSIDLNALLVSNPPATYLLKVQGDSMRDAGINDGDMLVVDFSREAKHGDIVIARLDTRFTVKRLYRRGKVMQLRAENRDKQYPPIVPQEDETLEIVGVVRWALHAC